MLSDSNVRWANRHDLTSAISREILSQKEKATLLNFSRIDSVILYHPSLADWIGNLWLTQTEKLTDESAPPNFVYLLAIRAWRWIEDEETGERVEISENLIEIDMLPTTFHTIGNEYKITQPFKLAIRIPDLQVRIEIAD